MISPKVQQFCRTFVDVFKMAADDNVQDKTITKIMESTTEDKKPDEIVPLTLESILCGLNIECLIRFIVFILALFVSNINMCLPSIC